MIALPLLLFGENETVSAALPAVTPTSVGAAGAVAGTTPAEGGDGGLVPTMLVAVTVHVYVLPFVRLVTTSGDVVPDFAPGVPPSRDVHVAA